MSGDTQGGHQPLGHTRQSTIDALCEHFANDVMSIEEFERRVDVANKADNVEEIKALLRDMPGGDLPAPTGQATVPVPKQEFGVTAAAHVKDSGFVVSVLGGASRKGRWTPARKNYAIAVMGGTELDFREAQFGPGMTEVQVFTCMGGVEIIVPPGLAVESHGIAIMGGFDHLADTVQPDSMEGPVLRISGVAVMGGVDVTVRHPGETAREARRRRKLERKERKRLNSGK